MAKKKDDLAYLHDCPDCIPLPTQFPTTCVSHLVSAFRDPAGIEDPKCVVHCGITMLAWGAGLWINERNPPLGVAVKKGKTASFSAGDSVEPKRADLEAAAEELEKCLPKEGTKKAVDLSKINWALIVQAILQILSALRSDEG